MRTIFSIILLTFFSITLQAQKFGHFSSDYIVQRMPAYLDAQKEIDQLTQAWMEEVKDRFIEIGKLESELAAEKILLTPAMLQERREAIDRQSEEAVEYQYKIFGPNGLLFLKKRELVKPHLDKVFEAVERVCKKQRLDYLLDKSSNLVMVYTNPVHDYTDYVLEELGLLNPGEVPK